MVDTNSFDHLGLDIEAKLALTGQLYRDRRTRDRSGLFYIEGVRNFVRAVDLQFAIDTIFYSEKLLTAPVARKLVRQARRAGVTTFNIGPERFRQISHAERASGVAAIVRQKWSQLGDIATATGLCWIVLESVRSAGNLGTLIRTSEAVGGAGFILLGNSIDPFHPDVLRASMGGLYAQQFLRTDLTSLSNWVDRYHHPTIGAAVDGRVELHQFDYPRSSLIFLGAERSGLTPAQRDCCQHLVRIPMVGTADSLNLGVAGSLFLYEVYRSSRLATSS
jgi:RNA methyltransferase, TrmH family